MNMLYYVNGRVIIKVWVEEKNFHTFGSGQVIRLERKYDNFDRRHTEAVQGEVVSSANIPIGATILFHHNSLTDENRIFNYKPLSGEEIASDIRYFSIPEIDAYLWRMPGEEWQPIKGFATALRVFEPYKGVLTGIPPKLLKDILYITSGDLSGKVVMTLRSSDYCIVFQDNGRERNIIRIRHSDTEDLEREEVQMVRDDLTDKLYAGGLLIGLTQTDAKTLKELTTD